MAKTLCKMAGFAGALAAISGCTHITPHQDNQSIRYVDAHSHIATSLTMDDEVIRFWKAGVDKVVLMDPDPAALAALKARNSDLFIPFISVARTPEMTGLRYDPGLAARMGELFAAGAVCGFGELPTRTVPNPHPSDAAALTTPVREEVYQLANQLGVPVNMHIALEDAETIAAVEQIASEHPQMKLVLAHAGWSADATVIAGLMDRHANVYADLSVRLDPLEGLEPGNPGPQISILQADGSLLPQWRDAMIAHPDRFLFGMDVTGDARPHYVARLMDAAKTAFSGLPHDIHAAIAGGNMLDMVSNCTLKTANVPQPPPRGFVGAIVSYDANSVTLKKDDGTQVTVAMQEGWTVVRPQAATFDSIGTGNFVGSANLATSESEGQSVELRVFESTYLPEAGTHAMNDQGRFMTHGNVKEVSRLDNGEAMVVIDQPGGTRKLTLPAGTPVTTYAVLDRSVLADGPRVSAVTREDADGVWRAGRVTLASED